METISHLLLWEQFRTELSLSAIIISSHATSDDCIQSSSKETEQFLFSQSLHPTVSQSSLIMALLTTYIIIISPYFHVLRTDTSHYCTAWHQGVSQYTLLFNFRVTGRREKMAGVLILSPLHLEQP